MWEILSQAMTWMNLDIMLREISPVAKGKYNMLLLL